MSKHFFQNAPLRYILLKTYRIYACSMFWRRGPKVFINSIPKAGTHLAMAILEEIPGLMQSRLHIDMWDVHAGEEKFAPIGTFKADARKFRNLLATVRGGQIVTGHLPWNSAIYEVLSEMGFRIIFITRAPQDIVNSNFHYIKGLRRIYIHNRLMNDYSTDEERRQAIEEGIPPRFEGDPCLDGISSIFQAYQGWLDLTDNRTLPIAFENLVGAAGGGSQEARTESIRKIMEHVSMADNPELVAQVERVSRSKKSFTYRSGKIGNSAPLAIEANDRTSGA